MKVLFVASGNKAGGSVSSFVRTQYESLEKKGLEMLLYPIIGHGVSGYFKHFVSLRKLLKKEKPDIVHAHYSVCGYMATMASFGLKNKVVVSILGSFPKKNTKLKIVRFFIDHIWDAAIVKSERTKKQLDRDLPVIPNGVDLEKFQIIEKDEARRGVGFESDKHYVIFVSNPDRQEKNYGLAKAAVELLDVSKPTVLKPVFDMPHDAVVKYMCAADVLLMTSFNEGSPNVIKEAMACNCPIVVTNVGDVEWVTCGVEGTYVANSYDPEEIVMLLDKAIEFGDRTRGRERILKLGLTTKTVADRIEALYSNVLDK